MHNRDFEDCEHILTVAVVNFHAEWGNKPRNRSRIAGYIEAAARRGAHLVVFPELALTGYARDRDATGDACMHRREAERIPGPATDALSAVTRAHGVYAAFGMPERDGDLCYNAAAVCGPEGLIGAYRKIHPFGDEHRWAARGDAPFWFDTRWGRIGVGICHDTYAFPELARFYAASGARLLLNPTALHRIDTWDDYYLTTLKHVAMTGGMFVASSNLAGSEPGDAYPGGSVVLGPGCDWLMGKASYCRIYAGDVHDADPGLHLATIDLSMVTDAIYRDDARTGRPDFRPALYARWYAALAGDGEREGRDGEGRGLFDR